MPMIGSGLIQAANTFVGAYDAIPSIAAAYSTRRLLTSYKGPLLRLVADRTGYPEQDIGYTAAGDLDTTAAASFLAGDTGYITKLYDQSGNALDFTQSTLANMPLYVASAQNSRPIVRGDGVASYMARASFPLGAEQSVVAAIVFLSLKDAGLIGGETQTLIRSRASGKFDYLVAGYTDGVNGIRDANAFGTAFGILSASRSVAGNAVSMWKNSSTLLKTTTISASGSSGTLYLFSRSTTNEVLDGDLGELIICNAALSTSDRQAAESAANAYWSAY